MKKNIMSKLPQILVAPGEKLAIMRLLNVTYPTIRGALRGTNDTELALRIRQLALKRGGVLQNTKPAID